MISHVVLARIDTVNRRVTSQHSCIALAMFQSPGYFMHRLQLAVCVKK